MTKLCKTLQDWKEDGIKRLKTLGYKYDSIPDNIKEAYWLTEEDYEQT